MKNKVYKVSQELADYVRSFNGSSELIRKALHKEHWEELDFLDLEESNNYNDDVLALWYADQYGYMEVIEDLYYVELVTVSDLKYLNQEVGTGTTFVSGKEETRFIKTKFTLAEIKAIDERYLPFAVKVDK